MAIVVGAADAVDEFALVTNVATGGGYAASTAASRTVRVTVNDDEQTGTDYDADNDGLIEVGGHAQLNAMRWDLDGNGSSANSGYAAAFPGAATGWVVRTAATPTRHRMAAKATSSRRT